MRYAFYRFFSWAIIACSFSVGFAAQAAEHQHLPGQDVTVEGLPPGLLRQQLEALPAAHRARALAKLRDLHFPDDDIQNMRADAQGGIFVVCSFEGMAAAPAAPPVVAEAGVPLSALPAYHSKPGLSKVIYLDFDGESVTGTAWNGSTTTFVCKAFDTDGDPLTFSAAELAIIQDAWQRVAEDYSPFAVDVTTEKPASYTNSTAHALITYSVDNNGVSLPSSGSGGVAYVGVFGGGTNTHYSPAWIYYNNLASAAKYIAEASSHEVGHNMGLSHDGTSTTAYYAGHGSGDISWAPIMGNGYYCNVTQWSKGEYPDANNTQDDLAIIAGKLTYSADVVGNTNATATALSLSGGTVVNQSGVIETGSDVDIFSFSCGAGPLSLTLSPFISPNGSRSGNLDIRADLYDASNALVASSDPATTTGATISLSVAQGIYYLKVSGVGALDLVTGYSDYGSLGQYTITGTITAIPVTNAISFSATAYSKVEGDSGSSTATITVTRNAGSGAVGVSYATANGTASAGSDYTAASGTLSWASGDTSAKTFTVTIAGDSTAEGDETISLSLSSPTGGAVLGTINATLTITDDDIPSTVWVEDSVPIGSIEMADSDAWTWVSSSPTPFSGSTCQESSITAGAHQHYFHSATQTLMVSPGDTLFAYVYLDPANPPSEIMLQWNDGIWEHRAYWGANALAWGTDGTDSLRNIGALPAVGQWVRLEVPASAVGLEGSTLTGMAFTLCDGRAWFDRAGTGGSGPSPGTLAFSSGTFSHAEGNSGTATVTITATRSGGSAGAVSVSYATANGTASAGSDYAAASGSLNWADGDAANKTFTVTINGDSTNESDETVQLALSSATGGATLGTSAATLTITNDDAAPAGTLAFSATTYTQAEGNSGTATVTITATRTGGSSGAVGISYATANGTATAGSDYLAASGTLSWANGDTADKTFTVTIIGDTVTESHETVALSLGSPTGGATLGTSGATLIIANDDASGSPSPGGGHGGGGGGGGCGMGSAFAWISLLFGFLRMRPHAAWRPDRSSD